MVGWTPRGLKPCPRWPRCGSDGNSQSAGGGNSRKATCDPVPGVNKVLTACGVEELAFGGVQLRPLKLLLSMLLVGWVFADGELRLAAVVCDV